MLKLRNKLVTVLAVMASLLILSGTILMYSQSAMASNAVLVPETQITTTNFTIGDEMDVPNASIEVGGESYAASNVYVRMPDGSNQNVTDGKFVFTSIGKHSLVYVAVVNGKQVFVETNIVVNDKNFNASQFTTVTKANADGTVSGKEVGELTVVDGGQKGIHARIPYTDKFVWNTPVDLAELGRDSSFLSFLPYQYSANKMVDGTIPNQASEIYVRITDAYNPDLYVTVRMEYFLQNGTKANQMPSYSAGGNGAQMRALSENLGRDSREGKIMDVGGTRYFVTYPERGGYPFMGDVGSSLIDLFYDVETNQVLVGQEVAGSGYSVNMITDVDASVVYGEQVFAGFTTGEVYLSIYTDDIRQDGYVDVEIASIGGQSGTELFDANAIDDRKPTLKVDVSREQIDNGLYVSKGQEVVIPSYDVKEVNFKGERFSIEVLYNDKNNVSIVDGKFVASNLGKYTITYTAIDDFGNKAEVVLVVNCVDRTSNNGKLIAIDLDQYSGEKKAGTTIVLPEVSITSPNAYVNKEVYALFGENNEKIAIDFESRELKLNNVGTYTIVYEYSDIFESGKSSYQLTSVASDVIEVEDAILPKYFIKGAKYSLDDVFAKTYTTTNPQLTEVTYKVSYDGGAFQNVDFANVSINANETVQFSFSHQGLAEPILSPVIKVVDVGFTGTNQLRKADYFQGDFDAVPYNISGNSHQYVFVPNKLVDGQASMDFVTPLSLDNLSVSFKIPAEYKNLKAVEFEITDYYNKANVVTVSYSNSGAGTNYDIINGTKLGTTRAFVANNLGFTYEPLKAQFTDNDLGLALPWTNTFTSMKVLLKITVKGVSGQAGINISALCGQNINNGKTDDGKPTATYQDTFAGTQKVGTVVTVSAAVGNDVFSPAYYYGKRITVTVHKIKNSKREVVNSIDGTALSQVDATIGYEFIVDDIADYQVTYQYKDQSPGKTNNNTGTMSYKVTTLDQVKPVIKIDGGFNEFDVIEGKLGQVHTAKGYTVSDNLDAEKDIRVGVHVIDPYFTMYDLTPSSPKPFEIEDMKFELLYKGEYIVYYYAEDTSGNVSTASYRIFVK